MSSFSVSKVRVVAPILSSLFLLAPGSLAGVKARSLSSVGHTCLQPSFQPLGDLSGGAFKSVPHAISPDGSTVVGYSVSARNPKEAFLWTESGGMQGLGVIPGLGSESEALGVSSYGTVVVGHSTGTSGTLAFRWTPSGGMQSMGDLPGGVTFSVASDVSAAGDRIVGYSAGANGTEGFLHTSAGGMVGLGDLMGGVFQSRALGISAFGDRIVGDANDSASQRAVYWDVPGSPVILRTGTGLPPVTALGANADGSIIVGTASTSSDPPEAFIWNGYTQTLGLLPFQTLSASSSSGTGDRVVGTGFDGTTTRPWIWDAVNGVRDLTTVMENEYGLSLAGWTLEACVDISGDGQRIIGYGTNPDGNREGFLAVLPISMRADINRDGTIDIADLSEFYQGYLAQTPIGDFNGDGVVDLGDIADFSIAYNQGC